MFLSGVAGDDQRLGLHDVPAGLLQGEQELLGMPCAVQYWLVLHDPSADVPGWLFLLY